MIYSADSNVFIQSWHSDFPPDVVPGFWDGIDEAISSGRLRASEEVLQEIERIEDDLHKWVKSRSDLFVPIDEQAQDAVTELLATHPRLLDTRKNRSGADPWVIALAKVHDLTVITKERPTRSPTRPHIPDVCDAYGIRWINVVDFIREQGWSFKR